MKNTHLTLFFCLLISVLQAQKIDFKKHRDSLAQISRKKADLVLKNFENHQSPKLLYSVDNSNYLIVLKEDCKYKEYFVSINIESNLVEEQRLLKTKKRDKKYLSKSFEFENYHTNYINSQPDATFVRGKTTYFVVKDIKGNRYGEYCLAAFTLPTVIDGELYGYLTRRLAEEIQY